MPALQLFQASKGCSLQQVRLVYNENGSPLYLDPKLHRLPEPKMFLPLRSIYDDWAYPVLVRHIGSLPHYGED